MCASASRQYPWQVQLGSTKQDTVPLDVLSQVPNQEKESLLLTCWLHSGWKRPAHSRVHTVPLQQRWSRSLCCPLECWSPFWQLLSTQATICPVTWDYFIQNSKLHICFCWTSWCFYQFLSGKSLWILVLTSQCQLRVHSNSPLINNHA